MNIVEFIMRDVFGNLLEIMTIDKVMNIICVNIIKNYGLFNIFRRLCFTITKDVKRNKPMLCRVVMSEDTVAQVLSMVSAVVLKSQLIFELFHATYMTTNLLLLLNKTSSTKSFTLLARWHTILFLSLLSITDDS